MKVNFYLSEEKLKRFSDKKLTGTGLAAFLLLFFEKEVVERALHYFGIRMDTRCACDGKCAAIFPFKDEIGRIRDVIMMLIHPLKGTVLRHGNAEAEVQNTFYQNTRAKYYFDDYGDKVWSLIPELTKDCHFVILPTLFGMDKISLFKCVCIVSAPIDAIVMSIIFPQCAWVATGDEGEFGNVLERYDVVHALKYKTVVLYPEIGKEDEARDWELYLLHQGIDVETDTYAARTEVEEWFREGQSVATIALQMLYCFYSKEEVISALGLHEHSREPF